MQPAIISGVATLRLVRALAQAIATGHLSSGNTCKNTITGM